MEQERQVLVAARRQKLDHFLVRLDGLDDLLVAQGPALVLVDELEALARGVLELSPARKATRETSVHLHATAASMA